MNFELVVLVIFGTVMCSAFTNSGYQPSSTRSRRQDNISSFVRRIASTRLFRRTPDYLTGSLQVSPQMIGGSSRQASRRNGMTVKQKLSRTIQVPEKPKVGFSYDATHESQLGHVRHKLNGLDDTKRTSAGSNKPQCERFMTTNHSASGESMQKGAQRIQRGNESKNTLSPKQLNKRTLDQGAGFGPRGKPHALVVWGEEKMLELADPVLRERVEFFMTSDPFYPPALKEEDFGQSQFWAARIAYKVAVGEIKLEELEREQTRLRDKEGSSKPRPKRLVNLASLTKTYAISAVIGFWTEHKERVLQDLSEQKKCGLWPDPKKTKGKPFKRGTWLID